MQSHDDSDFKVPPDFFARLVTKAEEMTKAKTNTITAGKDGEKPLAEEERAGFGIVRQLPADSFGLRISIGQVNDEIGEAYVVFRGDHARCLRLLERALWVLRDFRQVVEENE